jgi:hypothetical protein
MGGDGGLTAEYLKRKSMIDRIKGKEKTYVIHGRIFPPQKRNDLPVIPEGLITTGKDGALGIVGPGGITTNNKARVRRRANWRSLDRTARTRRWRGAEGNIESGLADGWHCEYRLVS